MPSCFNNHLNVLLNQVSQYHVDTLWLYNYIFFSQGRLLYLLTGIFHHFPEFLCENHYDFIGSMSPQCIQMRNIVSCAFQCNRKVPDPLTPGLNVASLPEIKQRPQFSPSYVKLVESMPFKKVRYLHSPSFIIYRWLINSWFV